MKALNLIKQLTFGMLFTAAMISCDRVKDPVIFVECSIDNLDESLNVNHTNGGTGTVRKILLEDYTGHTCGNCPGAAIKVKELVDKYGDQIVPMAVHADFFARPEEGYPTDFRTDAGDTYFSTFKVISNPNGMVNRTDYNGRKVLGVDQWDQAIQAIKDDSPEMSLTVNTAFNTDREILFVDAKVKLLQNTSKNYAVVGHIIEDKIIADQKDYSLPIGEQHVYDYEHNHVLRYTLNNATWGLDLNVAATGDEETISFSTLCFSEQEWKTENCIVVVYVIDTDTKEVVQADEVHIL